MNLFFKTIDKKTIGEQSYLVQRAIVQTDNKQFWVNWRTNREALKNKISLRKENGSWVVYRLLNEHSNLPVNAFEKNYFIKNSSKLLPYQIRAVEHICNAIIHHGSACDGSDTGLGKTYVALAVCRELEMVPAVVTTIAGIASWVKACLYMNIKPQFIVNWEKAKLDRFPYTKRYVEREEVYNASRGMFIVKDVVKAFSWNLPPRCMLIFDEAHMGNHTGSQNNMLYTAAARLPTLSLSATFADKPSRMQALLTVLRAIDPSTYKEWLYNRGHFENKYDDMEAMSITDDMTELSKFIYPEYGYRLRYTDPDVKRMFPEMINRALLIGISQKNQTKQNKMYQSLLLKVSELKEKGLTAEAMVADLRYRQATELLKADTLVSMSKNLISQGKSVVLFVNFRDTLMYVLKKMKTKSAIYGSQNIKERGKFLDAFQKNKNRFICAMVSAGGQSLDLHDTIGSAPRVALICPTYNAIQCKQVLGRIYRAGSKSTPVNILVYAGGTVEEKVSESVSMKMANISALQDGDLMEPDLFNLGLKRE